MSQTSLLMHNLIMLRETRRDSLFAVVATSLLAIATFRRRSSLVLAFLEHFPEHLVFVVCSSAVHCGPALAERIDTRSWVSIVVSARWRDGLFRYGGFAGFLAVLLVVDGEVTRVLLTVAWLISTRRNATQGMGRDVG